MTNEQLQQMQQVLQKSLIKIKTLEGQLAAVKEHTISTVFSEQKEAIAIVGCGVRLPDNIDTTQQLWRLLQAEKSVSRKFPVDRFDIDSIYDSDEHKPGKTNARFATLLENDVRSFDAAFFSIAPREAKSLDPLQRMVLEVVYEAFENAAIPSESLKGSNTGVYIALGNSDYISARFRSGNLELVDVYDTTGILFGTAGGRVSFSYDFTGPSYNVDAACASTVLALHLAKEDLQKNTIDLAVVSSANLLLTPEMFVGLSKLGSLSSSDQCKAFANDGDGYIRGEGCGVALLKRLSDAERDNDNIELVIKGSAVKHNGSSNGFTAPNPEVITLAIKEALKDSGLSAEDILYVESHGIGNRFTDAIEIQSIHEGYLGRNTPIYVGSVKANIGHLEAATGMPMLFKLIEIVRNKRIPAQININTLNEDVEWDKINTCVSTVPVDLSNSDKPIAVAINLSGYSGTNVHMIFEAPKPKCKSEDTVGPFHFIISAKNQDSLRGIAQRYLNNVNIWDRYTLTEICNTLQTGRNHFDYALSILGNTKEELQDGLGSFLNGVVSNSYIVSNPELRGGKELSFLFTGQGAQYFGMFQGYYDGFEVFRNSVEECDLVLRPLLGVSIKDILWQQDGDSNLIHQTKFTQPALFVVEYAMAKLWMHYGVQPTVLIGHSIGEIVALAVANAMDVSDALKLVVARATFMNTLPQQEGGMASVFCSAEDLRPLLEGTAIDLAAVNSVKNCTISGNKKAVEQFVEQLKEKKIRAIALNVSHAFHSHLMEPILEDFTVYVQQFRFRQPEIPVISNLTGKPLNVEDLTATYFANHIRGAVQFAAGIQWIQHTMGVSIYLEVGPNPVLISLAKQTNTDSNGVWLSSAKKDTEDVQYFNETLQQLYTTGISIAWQRLYGGKSINRVQLPTYAWDRRVYWDDPVFMHKTTTYLATTAVRQEISIPAKRATRETLLAYMQLEAAKVLGLQAGQKVDLHKTYREQGFDSMMSGEFLSLMEKHVDAELSMQVLHQYNTPSDLYQYLLETFFGGGAVDTTQAVTLADVMFAQEMADNNQQDWHEIKAQDGILMRWFKKIDKRLPSINKQEN